MDGEICGARPNRVVNGFGSSGADSVLIVASIATYRSGFIFPRVSDSTVTDDRNVAISHLCEADCAVDRTPFYFGRDSGDANCRLVEPTGDGDDGISLAVLAITNPSAHRPTLER